MKAAILSTESESDMDLLIQIARKLGLSANVLTEEETEDLGLLLAIEQGRTREYVDTDAFVKKLKNESPD